MKFQHALLTSFCLLAAATQLPSAYGAGELDRIKVITTKKYDPRLEPNRGASEFGANVGVGLAGIFLRDVSDKFEKQVLEKLNGPKISEFFPSKAERAAIARRISQKAQKDYLSAGLSNRAVILAIQYAAGEMVRTVVDRVMSSQGIADAKRRQLWITHLLGPMNGCFRLARTFGEATKCIDVYQADIPKNLGLAVGFELTRQELTPTHAEAFPARYVECLQPAKAGAEKRVMECVLKSVRTAIGGFGRDRILEIAKAQAPGRATAIADEAMPTFHKCLSTAKAKEHFRNCADQLTLRAGSSVAGAAVLENPQMKANVKSAKQVEALSVMAKERFSACVKQNLTANRRDPNGTVATKNCADRVRFDVAKAVSYEIFKESIAENLKGTVAEREAAEKSVRVALDKCWNSDAGEKPNNLCLRQTVQGLVSGIAEPQLRKELPPGLQAKEPKLREQLLGDLRTCLQAQLPENLMEASNTNDRVALCTGRTSKRAALKVGEFEIRDVLHGRARNQQAVDRIVDQLVNIELNQCLGDAPVAKTLDLCANRLRRVAGKSVAEALFPEEYDRFVKPKGGLAAFGLKPNDRNDFLYALLGKHRACINAGKAEDAKGVEREVEACFKVSSRTLAETLARMEFLRASRMHIPGGAEEDEKMADEFAADFSKCLGEMSGPQHSLKEFLAHVDPCRVRLTTKYTLKVARAELKDIIQSSLPAANEEQRKQQATIEKNLLGPFTACVEEVEAEDTAALDECANRLQSQAMGVIAVAAGERKAKELLNTPTLPAPIKSLETKLNHCLAGQRHDAHNCGKAYARGLAQALVNIKLHRTVADFAGVNRYKELQPELFNLEKQFIVCTESQQQSKLDAKFMQMLDDCSKALESAAVGLMRTLFATTLDEPSMSKKEATLAQELALTLPCFDFILPATPYEEKPLEALDPEGTLKEISKMIGDYIKYDVERAGLDYRKTLSQLVKDLEAAGPVEARVRLLDYLVKNGIADQLLKSVVLGKISESLASLPTEDKLPPELVAALTSKATLEKVFTPAGLEKLRPFLAQNVIRPILMEGLAFKDPRIVAALGALEKEVVGTLVESPHFGDVIVKGKIQGEINSQAPNRVWQFLGWLKDGYQTYDWEKVRQTPAGKETEQYFRDQIIRPRLSGEQVSPEEMKRRRKKLEELVKEALKKKS